MSRTLLIEPRHLTRLTHKRAYQPAVRQLYAMRHAVGVIIVVPLLTTLMVVTCIGSRALSDATTGELFGYRIGDRYPVNDRTQRTYFWLGNTFTILAEKPVSSGEVGAIKIVTTPKSYTIGNIHSEREFESIEDANAFAARYASVLRAKYPNWTPKWGAAWQRLVLQHGDRLALIVAVYSSKGENPTVQISLSVTGDAAREFTRQAEQEYHELVLDETEKRGGTKGL